MSDTAGVLNHINGHVERDIYGEWCFIEVEHSEDFPAMVHPSQREALILPGQAAPMFALHSTPDQALTLSDFKGKPVILAFYPADWSAVCGDQMSLYNQLLPEFQRLDAQLLGISVDGVWCHAAFAENRNLHFPLLADFEPKGAVAKSYGVYRDQDGTSKRALFVIDGEGMVRWSYISPIGINPGADGILTALEHLSANKQVPGASHE